MPPLLKAAVPGRAIYTLTALLGEGFDARNAIGDIEAMAAVMAKFRVREKDVLRDAKTTDSRLARVTILSACAALFPGLKGALCQSSTVLCTGNENCWLKLVGLPFSPSLTTRNKELGL